MHYSRVSLLGKIDWNSPKHVFLKAQLVRFPSGSYDGLEFISMLNCDDSLEKKKIRRNSLLLFTVPSYIPSLGNSQWQARAWGNRSHRIHGKEAESLSICCLERERKKVWSWVGSNGERKSLVEDGGNNDQNIFDQKLFSIWKGASNKCIYTSA